MATTTIHKGPISKIGDDASPGLKFLKTFLPVLDSVSAVQLTKLPKYMLPDATFILNNSQPMNIENLLPMLSMRSMKVARFNHDLYTTWDISKDNGGQTIISEGTSCTVFRDDEDEAEVVVRELNIIELDKDKESGDELKVSSMRTYMDPGPVSHRAMLVASEQNKK